MADDINRIPSREGLEDHQVWVWMNGPGDPHWEVRGTGVLVSELEEEMMRMLKLSQAWKEGYESWFKASMTRCVQSNPYKERYEELKKQVDEEYDRERTAPE